MGLDTGTPMEYGGRTMAKGKLQPEIPIPAPEQFLQHFWTAEPWMRKGWDECHCLVGWVNVACGQRLRARLSEDGKKFVVAVVKTAGLTPPKRPLYWPEWFDRLPNGRNSRLRQDVAKRLANAWVKTAREFGYDV